MYVETMNAIDFRHDLLPLKDRLFRLALRITLHRAEAEDVTQETLLRVWNKRDELADLKSLEAYCFTVCRNLAIDRGEKKDAQALSLDDCGMEAEEDRSIAADERMEREEKLRRVHEIFSRLPERQRTVMQLRDIEGMTYREVADAMGMTEEQVKITLFRARREVRTQYEKIENYGL